MEIKINIVIYAVAILIIRASSFGAGHSSDVSQTTSQTTRKTDTGSTASVQPSSFPGRGSTEPAPAPPNQNLPDSCASTPLNSSSCGTMKIIGMSGTNKTAAPSVITHQPMGLDGTATPQQEIVLPDPTSTSTAHKENAQPVSADLYSPLPLTQKTTLSSGPSAPSPTVTDFLLTTLAPVLPTQPASTPVPAWLHVEDPSELNIGDDVPILVHSRPPLDPLLAGLLSVFIAIGAIALLFLFLKFRNSGHPEFRRLQDLPMDDMMEDTPLSRYNY